MRKAALWVIVRGGLGNQMFQAAFGTALAARFGLSAKYVDLIAMDGPERSWELDCFGMAPQQLSGCAGEAFRILFSLQRRFGPTVLGWVPGLWIEEPESVKPFAREGTPRVVSGYWQRHGYVAPVDGAVRQLFRFPALPETQALPLAGRGAQRVAIHVRLGDYIDVPDARQDRMVCSPDWYRAAWRDMRQRLGSCQAFVFSEDIDWVKKEIGFDGAVDYVACDPSHAPWVDMARMSTCDSFIISNSSYSWWAAFLSASANKIVMAPKWWFGRRDTARFEICPPSWVLS